MTLDHSQCAITTTPQWEQHVCPPCPHGLERGGTFALTGDPQTDEAQRRLKLHAIDQADCSSVYHAKLLAELPRALSPGGHCLMPPCTCDNPRCPNRPQFYGCSHCLCVSVPDVGPNQSICYSGPTGLKCCKCGYFVQTGGMGTASIGPGYPSGLRS